MPDFQYFLDDDGVSIITWNVPHKSMNTMSWQSLHEMAELFEMAISDNQVKGIVLTSGKPDFASGMDLNSLAKVKEQAQGDHSRNAFELVMRFHNIFRKIELAGGDPRKSIPAKPIAAALPGTALGIGYEIPLICHRIFAANNSKAIIGLPEIKVGLFPGAGGTTRLVRRLGLINAGPYLLKGKLLSPQKALQANMIDVVTEPENLLEEARKWVLNAKPEALIKSWDKQGFRMPGGSPYDAKGYMSFIGASATLSSSTYRVYPAANAMLSAIYEGALTTFDRALEVEARWFTKVLLNPSSTAMINSLFINKKRLEKGASRPVGIEVAKLQKVGVVGAGMMGSGIALVSAQSGLQVVLIDRNIDDAKKGKLRVEKILQKQVKYGRIDKDVVDKTLGRISTQSDYTLLKDADLVIEAVYEDPKIKADVISRIDSNTNGIIASNTSTLPIGGLAKVCKSPDRFLGLHFFSPVDRMMLVEVIRGKHTSDKAVALSLDYVSRIRKTPIVVNDARFFYANRCVIPYLNEGIRMVGEGIAPALIENAAYQCGMPVGPLQLVDETSIELAVSIAKATKRALGNAYMHEDADRVIFRLADLGRLGRKANAGFYEYDNGKRLGLWKGLKELYPPLKQQPPIKLVKNRLLMIQAIEAVRTIQEGVLKDVQEGDVGAILGWGFAPWSGGPFSWLDMLGVKGALKLCEQLQKQCGTRFAAPSLLQDKAASGERFTQS